MDVSAQALNSFFEHVPVVVYRCVQKGLDRKFQFVSPHIHVLLGLTPKQLLLDPRAFFRRIHPEDRNKFLRAWTEHMTLPAVICVEYRIMTEENRVIWIQEHSVLSLDPQGQGTVCQGVLLEIPNYQAVQDELRRGDRELHSLTENFPDIIGRIDRKNRILYLNRWWNSPESFPPEKYLGKRLEDLGLSQKVADIFERKIANVFENGMSATIEISHPTFKGMQIFEVRFFPEPVIGKQTLTVLMICRDITDVRTAELAFKESDENFRQLAETIDSVFWIWDIKLQRMVYVSSAYERLWGGNAEKLINNHFDWLTVVSPEDRTRVENLFLKRLDGKSLDIEYRIIAKNHQVRWVLNRTFPVKEPSGEISRIIGFAQDVTERKKWEEERVRAAKLESLGLLAGGLAHDFNNLLTAIVGQLSLAKYGLDSSHPLFSNITEAEQASLKAQDLVKQLLAFSKRGVPVKKVVSLKNILEENVRLVLTGSRVKPLFQISRDLWSVDIDVEQICQVIHNLVINARQAMEEGGECIIQAHNLGRDEFEPIPFDHPPGVSPDRWVRIGILDEGIGISKENLSKIFDPYFTTKATGSGFGLATSYSIIKSHGGLLSAESEVGIGSTFSFVLPAISQERIFEQPVETAVKFGQGKILIMDDEIQIRKVLGEMVETCGYQCQTAKDGEEALRVFHQAQKAGDPFSAVILDLTIPGGLGGKDVIKQLLAVDPHVRAIVASGYSDDPVLANYQDYGFKGRVAKPFKLLDLSIVLNSVIQETVW